jgi:hypothetical protein
MIIINESTNRRWYATGAYIIPYKITLEDGTVRWKWVVDQFNDDTFDDDGELASIRDGADTMEELITPFGENDYGN